MDLSFKHIVYLKFEGVNTDESIYHLGNLGQEG